MKLVEQTRYVKLKASGRLPSPKGLALSIIRLLHRDDYRLDDLVRLVKTDPAISGEILKFSNSASFGRPHPIVSIAEAVTVLGGRQVGIIVTAFSILHDHRQGTCTEFDYDKFWSRALASAIATQALVSYARFNTEECFTAGLLSTLGELALAAIFPQRYGEIIALTKDRDLDRVKMERGSFGNDHRELNSTLLLEWGIPLEIVTAINYCEIPSEDFSDKSSRTHGLTLSLHLALAFADICVSDEPTRATLMPTLLEKAALLGISVEETYALAERIISGWKDWGKQLNILTHDVDLHPNSTLT